MQALLLGSTGTVVETARLERLAYNAAFEELGLDLHWNVATYCKLLEISGGVRRLDSLFGDDWLSDCAGEVYDLQEQHFEKLASEEGLTLRPGVAETICFCASRGIKLGWVTTATPHMLNLIWRYVDGLDRDSFSIVCSRDDAPAEKPDPAIYQSALELMGLAAGEVVAVEDSPMHQASALAAGLQCYLYPGEYAHIDHDVLVTRDLFATIQRVHTLWAPYPNTPEHGIAQ